MLSQFITIIALMRFPLKSQCLRKISLDRMAFIRASLYLPSVVHICLNAHVVCSQMFNTPSSVFNPDAIFIDTECFVSLAYKPFIGLVSASGVRCDNKPRPESVLLLEVGQLFGHGLLYGVNPIDVRLQIKIIPQPMAEDEGIRLFWLACAERLLEAHEFIVWNRKANDNLD